MTKNIDFYCTGFTFIIVTHDITSLLSASDHIYLLGRERNAAGERISGARIEKEYGQSLFYDWSAPPLFN